MHHHSAQGLMTLDLRAPYSTPTVDDCADCLSRDADGVTGQPEKASPAHGSAAPRSSNKRVIALVAPGSSSPPKRRRTAEEGGDADGAQPSSPATASTVSSLSGAERFP